jgi:hypothetical protein
VSCPRSVSQRTAGGRDSRSRLRCSVVGRDAKSVVVVSDVTNDRIRLEDRTGDVELLLGLLERGRSSETAVAELTAHRDGVEPAAVWSALEALRELGLC